MKKLNILIANDDGYFAPGIRTLAARLSAEHNIVVSAPLSERSGYSHQVHFFSGISYEKKEMPDGIETYAVDGSPADCVIFALKHLCRGRKFDVVLSGINSVRNIGSDVMYSGTVGAAQEGTFHRVPSIAVSLRTRGADDYAYCAEFIAKNLHELIKYATENITLNVNVPSTKKEDILGVRVTPVAYRPYVENYICQTDSDGKEIFIVNGKPDRSHIYDENCDVVLSDKGYITITPIQMICNDREALNAMRSAEFDL
ncbi:MAG: 5'/3'-nucleotidase SurE [Bacteroides sp.]|nr:5'/3'-nucleotidase SurE [Bacillota bacterium]MCM1393921.1 5'/3'-nucleotidase SurE [[Eubacterium] siraeum]MCM1456139.1 5'/3'-nucleotidase SurE [Bacteroides sp.]